MHANHEPVRIPRIAPDFNGRTRLPVSSLHKFEGLNVVCGLGRARAPINHYKDGPNRNDGVVELVERREMSGSEPRAAEADEERGCCCCCGDGGDGGGCGGGRVNKITLAIRSLGLERKKRGTLIPRIPIALTRGTNNFRRKILRRLSGHYPR